MKPLHGLYLVVDPRLGNKGLMAAEAAIEGGVDLVQLLQGDQNVPDYAKKLREITKTHDLPFLVNNDVHLARVVGADGVHLDGDQHNPVDVRKVLGRNALVGFTCGNDLKKVHWAAKVKADYISFCSIFPSGSAEECEIVPLETVARGRKEVDIPIFASGGITHENALRVLSTGIDGIAVISAVLKAPDPKDSARRFKQILDRDHQSPPSTLRSRATDIGTMPLYKTV